MNYLIIGAGPAGVVAAEHLRQLDPDSPITIIGEESEPPYSRMALPYYLSGRIQEQGAHLRSGQEYYDKLGIRLLQDRVTRLESATRQVHLKGGDTLSFDRLLIATGSVALRPPIEGAKLPGVLCCWTLQDSREIARRAGKGSRVVLMGAGFIGCILLEALVRRGSQLTVVEMGDRMVPRMLDQKAGGLLKKWCIDKGVQVHTSTRIERIQQAGSNLAVYLQDGKTLPADLVICATGVKPQIDFLQDSDVNTDFGVLVNQYLQSNQASIYAAGDVCQGKDFSTGEYSVQAIQPTAAEHGRIAALNMTGRRVLHPGSVNMNVLDTLGLVSNSFGLWQGVKGGDSAALYDESRYRYLNLQFQEEQLVGAQAIGIIPHVGVLRGLIQARVRLGKWKESLMRDPSKIMEAYLGCTQAIGHNAGMLLA